MKLNEIKNTAVKRMLLIYGEPFIGKSTSTAMLSELFDNTYFVDFENRVESLLQLPESVSSRVDYYPINFLSDFTLPIRKMYNWAAKGNQVEGMPPKIKDLTEKDLVILDSATVLTKSAFYYSTRKVDFTEAIEPGVKHEEWSELRNWAQMNYYFDKIIGALRTSKATVAVITHGRDIKYKEGIKFGPIISTANYSATVLKDFDEVIAMFFQNKQRKIINRKEDSMVWQAGTRTQPPINLQNYDHSKLYDLKPLFTGESANVKKT